MRGDIVLRRDDRSAVGDGGGELEGLVAPVMRDDGGLRKVEEAETVREVVMREVELVDIPGEGGPEGLALLRCCDVEDIKGGFDSLTRLIDAVGEALVRCAAAPEVAACLREGGSSLIALALTRLALIIAATDAFFGPDAAAAGAGTPAGFAASNCFRDAGGSEAAI